MEVKKHTTRDVHDEIIKSPFSRVYIRPETEQVINCAMGFKHPIDINAMKQDFSNTILLQHPIFSSLLIKPRGGCGGGGRERWRKTQVKLDDHFILHQSSSSSSEEEEEDEQNSNKPAHPLTIQEEEERESSAVMTYLSELAVSSPLSRDKPLWEVHVFIGGGLNFIVLRIHHGIGDGVSLMSMLAACFCQKKNKDDEIHLVVSDNKKKYKKKRRENGGVWEMMKSFGLTIRFVIKAAGRSLWVKDDYRKMGFTGNGGSGGGGGGKVEIWDKVVVSAMFKLDDMKSVKRHVPNATTNDVLLGIISSGLSRYLKIHSPQGLSDGLQITGVLMVNMRKTPGLIKPENLISGWGNKVGVFIIPINYYSALHPLHHVKRAKSLMDNKKRSFEPQIVDKYNSLTTYFCGPKVLTTSYRRVARNTTFMLSNIMGPQKEISIAGNPVTYIKLSTSSLPTVITMHMVSYMGKANLQVMVPKDIIHDPPFLAKCFEDSLLEMITTPIISPT